MYTKPTLAESYASHFKNIYPQFASEDYMKMKMWDLVKYGDKIYAEMFEFVLDPIKTLGEKQWETIN